jgi:uncharacterized membrane protein
MGESTFTGAPVTLYGAVLLGAGTAYSILVKALLRAHAPNSALAQAVGRDFKGNLSVAIYLFAIAVSLIYPWIAYAMYAAVAAIWLVPDRRIEKVIDRPRLET